MWQAIQGLEKKSDLWAGTLNKRITDASLKLKMPETAVAEWLELPIETFNQKSKNSFLSCADYSSDEYDGNVHSILGKEREEKQDGGSRYNLLKEIEEE